MSRKEVIEFNEISSRLDSFLAGRLNYISRNQLKELIKSGKVLVDGRVVKPAYILNKPCRIEIILPSVKNLKRLKKNIIYEDKHIIVFSKPHGLLVHPLSPLWERFPKAAFFDRENLAAFLLSYKKVLSDGGVKRAGLVHRLDSNTSGVMVIAKSCNAQENLVGQFRERRVSKVYKAICSGDISCNEGVVDIPVGRVSGGKIKASPLGRNALTRYKVLRKIKGYAFLKLVPQTGRTNQIRVHLSWLGCPVLGDSLYKGKPYTRLMLHAESLTFTHPHTNKKVSFKVACPKEFSACWKELKKCA